MVLHSDYGTSGGALVAAIRRLRSCAPICNMGYNFHSNRKKNLIGRMMHSFAVEVVFRGRIKAAVSMAALKLH